MRQPRTRIAALRTKKPAAIHRSVRGGSRSSCGRSGRGSSAIALHHDAHAEALAAGEPQGAQAKFLLRRAATGEGDRRRRWRGQAHAPRLRSPPPPCVALAPSPPSRGGKARPMELLLQQILAGLATGGIYACMALAVVMIYQAIDHLNFAQGEMAMFSTFISWQLMQWGFPYWWAFLITLAFSFAGGIVIERLLFKPLAKAPILTNVAGFIALYGIINSFAGLIWDFTIKQYPTPFGSAPFLGSQLISTHQAGMIGVTVLLLIGLYAFF